MSTSPVARIAVHSIFPAKQLAHRVTKPPLQLPCQTVSSTGLRTSQRSWSPSPREHRTTPPHEQGLPCPSPPAVFPHPGNRRAQRPRQKKTERHMRSQVCVDGAGAGMDRRLRRLRSAWDLRCAAAVPALARAWAYRVRVVARALTHADIPEARMAGDTDSPVLLVAMPCRVLVLRRICEGFLAGRGRS